MDVCLFSGTLIGLSLEGFHILMRFYSIILVMMILGWMWFCLVTSQCVNYASLMNFIYFTFSPTQFHLHIFSLNDCHISSLNVEL